MMKNYKVKINGVNVDIKEARVSAIPFNQFWPGYQRSLEQTEISSFVNYCGSLPAYLEVEVSITNKWYDVDSMPFRITPASKKVKLKKEGTAIKFLIEEYGQFVLDKDGHSPLCVFVSAPQVNEGATYSFTNGTYDVGVLKLKTGDSVYIGENAVVNGSIFAENAHNIRIYGRGILDGSYEERVSEHCYEDYTKGTFKIYGCKNVNIEGIIMRNSAIWVVNLFACENVVMEGVKLVGHWRYNTDGVDIVNSRDVTIKNCFIWVFDDGITLKAIDLYGDKNVENIFVSGCVLWCGWGRTLEIGLETACASYNNIIFKDCDLIHNSAVALDIQNGDYATVENVLFENIRVEYQQNSLPEIIQRGVSDFYEANGRFAAPKLIGITNPKYNFEDAPFMNKRCEQFGIVRNVIFKDIQAVGTGDIPEVYIDNCGTGTEIYDIKFNNITFNGKELPAADYKANIGENLFSINKNVK